jgi:23S rRNA pseudouridine1911/1915/1917 synthase
MLRERNVSKTYWAVIKNNPKNTKDTLIHFLKKNPKNNKSTVFKKEAEGSKKAILHYTIIKNLKNYSLLEIDLETGRHHQIRAQLSFIGSPIKGDLKYGAYRSNKDGSIHLHARKINFTHPVSKKIITIIAPVPNEVIWNACM